MIEDRTQKRNILFISSDDNYFVKDTPSFYRMYKNLSFFHKNNDYNVIVLQPKSWSVHEDEFLKGTIKCYYFQEIKLFRNRFIQFTDFNPFFIVKIIEILKNHHIDLIHVDYPYGINVLRLLTKIPISYNAYNVEALFWKQIVYYYKKMPFFLRSLYSKFIYFLEKRAVKIAIITNAISSDDKKLFERIYHQYSKKIFVNGMGLNEEVYNNPIHKNMAREIFKIDNEKFVVAFHGNYYKNMPNREAIQTIRKKIAPQVKDKDVLFLIAGKMPFLKKKKNLRFLGFVNKLTEFLNAADVAVVPIFRGSGVKVKVIDYLSSKIPVILTSQAAKGLFLKNDVHGYVVSDENPIEEIIDSILKLKKDSRKIIEFKNNIQKLLEKKYNWKSILLALEKRYREIIIRKLN